MLQRRTLLVAITIADDPNDPIDEMDFEDQLMENILPDQILDRDILSCDVWDENDWDEIV